MSLPIPDRGTTLTEMRDSASRLTDLLRSVDDPEKNAIGYWNVSEVAAHLTHIFRVFGGMVKGEPSPIKDHLRMSEHWDMELRNDDERELKVLADRIEESVAQLERAATEDRWQETLTWHGGIPIPLYSLPCIVINECEIHGLDVASAESRDWAFGRDKALAAIVGLFPVLPYFVRSEVAREETVSWAMTLRGRPTVYFLLLNGKLEVTDEAPEKVDCRVSADPVEYLLVGYGRKSRWGPIATGKIVAYGRKPWLSLKLAKLFQTP
jgi:uncharacterized protein (TIGR03083 family)